MNVSTEHGVRRGSPLPSRWDSSRVALGVVAAAAVAGVAVSMQPWTGVALIVVFTMAAAGLVARQAAATDTARGVARDRAGLGESTYRSARSVFYVSLTSSSMSTFTVAGSTTVSDALIWVTVALVVGTASATGERIHLTRTSRIFALGLLAVAVGGLIASSVAADPWDSMKLAFRMLLIVGGIALVAPIVLKTAEHVRIAVKWWVAGVAISSLVAILQVRFQVSFGVGIFAQGRASGLTDHFDDIGSIAGLAAIAGLAVWSTDRTTLGWTVGAASAVACAGGVIASGSIGGLIASAIAIVVYVSLSPGGSRFRQVAVIVAVALVVVSVMDLSSSSSPTERLAGFMTGETAREHNTGLVRVSDWQYGLERSVESPFAGHGLDQRSSEAPSGARVQNVILQGWFEAGYLGLLGACLMVFSAIGAVVVAVRSADEAIRGLAVPVGAVLAGSVFLMFEQIVLQKSLWWPPVAFALALGAVAVAARPARRGGTTTLA